MGSLISDSLAILNSAFSSFLSEVFYRDTGTSLDTFPLPEWEEETTKEEEKLQSKKKKLLSIEEEEEEEEANDNRMRSNILWSRYKSPK